MSGIATASLLPEPPRRRHEEDDLQRSIVQFLRWALPTNAFYFHIPNGGQRHTKAAQRLVPLGVRAGVPDLCIVYAGSPIFIELKAKTGALSALQRQVIDKLRLCGADVLICRSLPCVETALLELGVPLRATSLALAPPRPEKGNADRTGLPALQREQCDGQDRKTPASDSRGSGLRGQDPDYSAVGSVASPRNGSPPPLEPAG